MSGSPAVELKGVCKRFAGVRALEDVSVSVAAGEIHSVVGENGAGKSTLLNVLTGLIRPDAGSIRLGGREVTLRGPREARAHGISFVPQDVRVVPGLSAGRNATLGLEPRFAPRLRLRRTERERASAALQRAGASYSLERRASTLSVPELRLCQIARALADLGDVLVLDEPTAAVSEHDAEHLLGRLEALRDDGEAIMYVSHRLSEVLRVSDRITVLRDGRVMGTFDRGELNREELVALMAKEARANGEPAATSVAPPRRERVLEAVALWAGRALRGVSFSADRGQIVGIAGVQGSGHGELLHVLAGTRAPDRGSVRAFGVALQSGSVRAAAAAGIALIPADRRRAAIVGPRSIRDNIVLPTRGATRRFGVRAAREERRLARRYVDALDVRPRDLNAAVGTLSGGNQQKVALARARASDAQILLLEEPTQGIDVHAKSEIRRLIRDLAAEGRTVVIATSEFAELSELADVVHVMRLGELQASLAGPDASYETLLRHALP